MAISAIVVGEALLAQRCLETGETFLLDGGNCIQIASTSIPGLRSLGGIGIVGFFEEMSSVSPANRTVQEAGLAAAI